MKNKFYNVIEDATAGLFNENVPYVEARMKAAEKCEQIADEYAIGFAEWYFDKGQWIEENLKTKQLLEIYKQSLKTTI